jgi:diacylglycerol kinase (ATP)
MKFKFKKKRNIFKAFLNSINGVKAAWRNEIAFRQEVVLFISSIPFAVLLGDSLLQIVALLGVLLFVIVVELLNSAIETVINRISTGYHILSGRAKDMSSAAVLGALLIAAFTWVSILIENIFL